MGKSRYRGMCDKHLLTEGARGGDGPEASGDRWTAAFRRVPKRCECRVRDHWRCHVEEVQVRYQAPCLFMKVG